MRQKGYWDWTVVQFSMSLDKEDTLSPSSLCVAKLKWFFKCQILFSFYQSKAAWLLTLLSTKRIGIQINTYKCDELGLCTWPVSKISKNLGYLLEFSYLGESIPQVDVKLPTEKSNWYLEATVSCTPLPTPTATQWFSSFFFPQVKDETMESTDAEWCRAGTSFQFLLSRLPECGE